MEFDEEYFKGTGFGNYRDYPHFKVRADFVKDVLKPAKGVIVFGGAMGYLNEHLSPIKNINWETSTYCATKSSVEADDTKIVFNDYDWIVSWNVLDCLTDTNVAETVTLLNTFKGNQLHVVCCDGHANSSKFKKLGYFIQTHDYWTKKLPTANLICYDCRKAIQGTVTKVPLSGELVSE